MKKHFLDLFSGLGGASEAFLQDERNWSVLRIDNNPLLCDVPNTRIMDIRDIQAYSPRKTRHWFPVPARIECIWASPPCTEFSGGFHSPKSKAARAGKLEEYNPDLSLLQSALDIIKICEPKYWVIENVIGSIRYFEPILGKPKQIIGPYVLWGNFPTILCDEASLKGKKKTDYGPSELRPNYRALVDIEVSRSLKSAIESQYQIFDFM